MQERILIAPNGTELLRMLARSGISTLGLRIMQSVELAQFALMRSGVPLTETPVTPDAEAAFIYKSLPEIPYFKSASLHDAQNLAGTLRTLRLQITDNERETIAAGLNGSPFAEKNEALLKVYDAYTAALQENGMIDSVGILRYAISRAKPLSAECLVLQEYPPAPLEQAVIAQISGGTAKTYRCGNCCKRMQNRSRCRRSPNATALSMKRNISSEPFTRTSCRLINVRLLSRMQQAMRRCSLS